MSPLRDRLFYLDYGMLSRYNNADTYKYKSVLMEQTKGLFDHLKSQTNNISSIKLNDFFASLEPVAIEEMTGMWLGGYFPTGCKLELLLKDFILFKWHGKIFFSPDNVKAVIFSFLGMTFNVPGCSAILRELPYRGKVSTSMIYDYLPVIDHFRKVAAITRSIY